MGNYDKVPRSDLSNPSTTVSSFFSQPLTQKAFKVMRWGSMGAACILAIKAGSFLFNHPAQHALLGGYLGLAMATALLSTGFELLNRPNKQTLTIIPKHFTSQTILDITKSLFAMLLLLMARVGAYTCALFVALQAIKTTPVLLAILCGIGSNATGLIMGTLLHQLALEVNRYLGWPPEKTTTPAVDYIATKMIPHSIAAVITGTSSFFLLALTSAAIAQVSAVQTILGAIMAAATAMFTFNVSLRTAFLHDKQTLIAHCDRVSKSELIHNDENDKSLAHAVAPKVLYATARM